jgi:Ca2+/Na+ antiporter
MNSPAQRGSRAKSKITISTWLFIGGALCFVFFFLSPTRLNYFSLVGWTTWACAYFVVLAQNYRRKAPIHTRASWVKYESQPRLYKSIYFLLFLVGLLVVFVLFMINMFPT